MPKNAQAIPKGYHTVTPSLFVAGAAKAIDFYKKALGAEERMRFPAPEVAKVGPGPRWSILQTIEALFSRAAPSLSSYFYDVLGGDAANEVDE